MSEEENVRREIMQNTGPLICLCPECRAWRRAHGYWPALPEPAPATGSESSAGPYDDTGAGADPPPAADAASAGEGEG
ncbi:MAG TPA: hypothetical protein VLK82_15665 [Candidatus Tectomicrobia bacterium]|nr:hypothetical protein [Candidatus Tectomicrobia bacterium]